VTAITRPTSRMDGIDRAMLIDTVVGMTRAVFTFGHNHHFALL
jgi:hypothetical protein